MAFSNIVRPSATAAMRAIWWSSAVVSSLIIEAVIFFPATGQLDADLIGQAEGDFTGLLQPALAHAVLTRAGVGGDARLASLYGDNAGAKRPGYFDLLVTRQWHFTEDFAAATDDCLVGETAIP